MNNLDVVITGAQGEGKSRLARDIMRQVLPSAARVKDFADIDDLVEISGVDLTLYDKIEKASAHYIIIDDIETKRELKTAKEVVAGYRLRINKPYNVFVIYVRRAFLILFLSLSLMGCSEKLEPRYAGCVEQEVKLVYNESEMYLFTYVWYKDQVISCNRDIAETISDSVASDRRRDGLELLKTIKSINAKTKD